MNLSIAIPIIAGWAAALLVNYLADVLPATRKLTSPACKECAARSAWTDYLLLKGCSACGHPRGWRTLIAQILGVASSLYVWLSPPKGLGYWLGLILLVYLAVIFIIDLEHRLILNPTSIFGAILALGLGTLIHGIKPTLLGGLAGYGIMYALYGFGVLFTKLRAKRMVAAGLEPDDEDALGFGDVNLAGILGLLLGWPSIWFGLLLGILAGGAISLLIIIIVFIRQRYQENALMIFIPYGPYFILSTFILLYLPHWITAIL
jgi:prepilin signal peptidase PulO-like enzyme (type II secretory pathway)